MAKTKPAPKTYPRKPVRITVYKWAGKWGPFKVKIPCGECALTTDVVKDTLANELKNAEVELVTKDWLTHWFEAGRKGGWHAPVIMVDDEIISQGGALNRGVLAEEVINRHVYNYPMTGTHIFGKDSCPHCTRAKAYMDQAGIEYTYHDVVKNPGAMYEMIIRTKQNIGDKTPVTTPQIWIDGEYIHGGADGLRDRLGLSDDNGNAPVEPNSKVMTGKEYWSLPTPAALRAAAEFKPQLDLSPKAA